MFNVEFTSEAEKQFLKPDAFTQKQLQRYIDRNLNFTDNPRQYGKALQGKYKGLWRYDTGKHRLICNIEDNILQILVIKIGHRREVYR
jgi:mRNA interferase RelE/StbE